MNKSLGIFLAIILSFAITSAAHGKTNHIFYLDHTDGLSSNRIRSIGQDRHGFVWVATLDGLNRFDGKKFKSYTKENSGLTSNELNSVLADPHNPDIMWISTRHDGICKFNYKTGKITVFKGDTHTRDIPHLSLSSDSNIWITNYYYTPDKLNTVTGKVERIYNSVPKGMPRQFWCTVEDRSLPLLYMGHDGGGFTVIDLKSKKFKNFRHSDSNTNSLGGNHVYSIYQDEDGLIWLGTENGVSIYNHDSHTFTNISCNTPQSSLLPGAVMTICPTADGDIWFGTKQGGVCIMTVANRLSRKYTFINLNDLPMSGDTDNIFPHIQAIFEDSFGNKWIGSLSEGLDVVAHESPFFMQHEPFPLSQGKPAHQAVWSTSIDKDGNIWLGGEDEIMKINGAYKVCHKLPLSSAKFNTIIRAIMHDSKGIIWIGTSNDGAFTFNPQNNSFHKINVPENEVRSFLEDSDGSVIVGTLGGLYRCSDGINATPDKHLGKLVSDKYITAMKKDKHGNIWIGTFGKGVTIIAPSGKSTTLMRTVNGFPSFTINSLMEDSKGNMWVATREGAARVSGHDYTDIMVINNKNGLTNNDIKSIEEDSDGNVWLSMNNGIAIYNTSSGKVSSYHKTCGRTMNSFTEGSSCIDNDNNIIFGSINGITLFKPAGSATTDTPGTIRLCGLSANDKNADNQNIEIEIPVNSEAVELPYNLNTFTVRYCNPDISETANSEYSYNMEGINKVWTADNGTNEAVYRNLRPGQYIFRVIHRHNGGEWSKPVNIVTITITPPLYLTWWAKLLYVLSAIIIFGLFLYYYKHRVDLEKNLAIEKENSKNNQMLNEERLVFFTNITHELRTPLSLIVGPIEDLVNDPDIKAEHRKKLLTIRTSSMRLLNLINGILEFRKTETHNKKLEVVFANLANYVREIGLRFKELNSNPNVSFVIDVAEMEGKNLYYDPEIITIILNNLLGNAMKYTKSGTITLSLHPANAGGVNYVDLCVTDTGEGISKESLPHIFERYYQAKHSRNVSGTGIGLALTKNLVDIHEGSISVLSEEGKGSKFSVRLLTDNSYPNALHKEVEECKCEAENNAADEKTRPQEELSVLVVEDDDDVRDYIVQALGNDYNVYTADNGATGLKTVMTVIPDIVVSDIMMPVIDGFELCRKIKSETAISHIPVILLTAKDSLLDKEEGYASGADSYITKPFSANLLKARINNIIESRHKLTMRMLNIQNEHPDDMAAQGNPLTNNQNINDLPPRNQKIEVELTPFDREFIAKFKRLTEDNIEVEELDISFFTDKMCMSHSTLYRKVKSITGFTPNEFIRKIKLNKAAEILMSGKMPISEIPYRTGFNSPAYFRRVFKKEFGVSPTEYIQAKVESVER